MSFTINSHRIYKSAHHQIVHFLYKCQNENMNDDEKRFAMRLCVGHLEERVAL